MSIMKNIKRTKRLYLISFIIALIQIAFSVAYNFLITDNSSFTLDYNLVCLLLVEIFAPLNGISIEKYYNNYTADNNKKKTNLILSFAISNPLFIVLLAFMTYQLKAFYMLGYTYGLAFIFLIIAHIFYITVLIKLNRRDFDISHSDIDDNPKN